MDLLIFELAGTSFALKLERVRRILAPGEPLPPGCRLLDLGRALELPESPPLDDARQGHRAVLEDQPVALRVGRPIGRARVEPTWVLPLPGYIFCGSGAPVKGIIDVPAAERRKAATGAAHHGLLLDDRAVAEHA